MILRIHLSYACLRQFHNPLVLRWLIPIAKPHAQHAVDTNHGNNVAVYLLAIRVDATTLKLYTLVAERLSNNENIGNHDNTLAQRQRTL